MRKVLLLLINVLYIFHPINCDCSNELLNRAKITASSFLSNDRSPNQGVLDGKSGNAWTAQQSDFGQYLLINLGDKFTIKSIKIKGKQFTSEFVQEFKLDYANDGLDYTSYRDKNGHIKLFEGNKDGESEKVNYFEPPIIAQYIRINPTRWKDRISMRVQLYGCDYVSEPINFDGMSYVVENIRNNKISSLEDMIRFRFKTKDSNGNILFSKGTQGDILSLYLKDNKLVLSINLGDNKDETNTITAGSLLDDNLWHDVFIFRKQREILFTVDRVLIRHRLYGNFVRLDLNHELFIGGIPMSHQHDLNVKVNFTGCIENLILNNTNLITEIKSDIKQYLFKRHGDVLFSCRAQQVIPVTFKTKESYLKVEGVFQSTLNISLDFRTFNDKGVLIHHKFTTIGFITVYLDKGKLLLSLQGLDTPATPITIDAFPKKILNDGNWHEVSVYLETNKIILILDKKPSITIRQFQMSTGSEYFVGGGVHSHIGFIGCIRYLYIQGRYISVKALPPENIFSSRPGEIILDSCQMIDRCYPNPCEHGGICRQTNDAFQCDCSHTGYGGAVCRIAKHPLSCEAYRIDYPRSKKASIEIDVDGSGPLEPFQVNCQFPSDSPPITILHHRNEAAKLVQGFNAPGSYIQDIEYDAKFDQILGLVNRSNSCSQFIKYECLNARLFNSPYNRDQQFQPSSWWVSRNNKKMDYWGGSLPGSRKCNCGLYGTCRDSRKWCNCDSTGGLLTNEWLTDEGMITQKEYLPVRQVRIGDTGQSIMSTKQAKFTIGPLYCLGDTIYENTITFRHPDATIDLPIFEIDSSADIYFQFRTTVEYGVLLHTRGLSDFLKLAITGAKEIQFTYNIGNGLQELKVTSASRLSDNNWHSVLVEINRKEARLIIDGKYTRSLPHSGPIHSVQFSSNLVIGANVDYHEGYVGCIRAFLLNGKFVDLLSYAKAGLYGVSSGCVGKCESNPCLNNGTCIERYSTYTCDCQWTAFKGPICADEIGVNLRSDNYIRYDFESAISTLEENIRVGFTTTEHRGLILGVSALSGEYFNLIMSTSGHLRLVFDFGFERQEIIIRNENFALGQHHDIRITRSNQGRKMTIYVDNYEPIVYTYTLGIKTDAQFTSLKSIYIGRNETMNSGEGFVGCISRVSFDDHFPLRRLFQLDKRENVRAFPEDSVREDTCGIESVTHPPDAQERRPPMSNLNFSPSSSSSTIEIAAIVGGLIAIIVILIILLLLLSGRFIGRQKGDYVTNEDKGARDALDPDTAVVKGKTGPDISKKKEYFI